MLEAQERSYLANARAAPEQYIQERQAGINKSLLVLDGLLFVVFSELLVLTFAAVLILKEGEVDLSGRGLSGKQQTAAQKPSRRARGKQQRAV